jgi:hypothetical protein
MMLRPKCQARKSAPEQSGTCLGDVLDEEPPYGCPGRPLHHHSRQLIQLWCGIVSLHSQFV